MRKRSINIHGHQTSLSMEGEFWDVLKEIAEARGLSLNKLVAEIDDARDGANLCSAIRIFVLRYCREQSTDADNLAPRTAPE